MRWLKRRLWKVGIIIAGMLLIFMVWVPVSVAGAGERTSRLGTPLTGPVQATPTEDATVTALNKEKLAQEVQQLKNQNAPDLLGWLRTNAAVLVVVIGGLIGLFRWFGDRRSERKKRMEERFQAAVTGLGDDREDAKIGVASLLRTFLRPGYEQFYTQIFDLAVAHLRPRKPDLETTHDPEASALAPLNQALIAVLEEAFPRAREWVKQGSPSSRLQRITAWLKRILRREKPFDPRSLDARYIQLGGAFLLKADLEQVWMPHAFLQDTDLTEANLEEADLSGADLSGAKLCNARLCGAKLMQVLLSGARDDLREADVSQIKLIKISCAELRRNGPVPHEANRNARYWKILREWANRIDEVQPPTADLSKAEHLPVDLNGADLTGADFRGVKGLTKEQLEACFTPSAIAKQRCTNPIGSTCSGRYIHA